MAHDYPNSMAHDYLLIRHDEDGDGSPLFVPMSAHESSADAVKALKELVASGTLDLQTAVFSVFRRVYGDLKPRTQERVTVKLDGLAPAKPRGPRKPKGASDASGA